MSDERLRQLERGWNETGSPEDHDAYLREAVRVGEISRDRRISELIRGYLSSTNGNEAVYQGLLSEENINLDWQNIPLPLLTAFRQVYAGSILHSDQLCKERLTDESLRNEWLMPGDGAVYRVEDKAGNHLKGDEVDKEDAEVVLYLTRQIHNPIFKEKNIEDACQQLRTTFNYIPSQADVDSAVGAVNRNGLEGTVRIELSNLRLQTRETSQAEIPRYAFFTIDTENYAKPEDEGGLNETEKVFAERIYGSMKKVDGESDFDRYMKLLNDSDMEETKVFVVNPEYVKRNIRNQSPGSSYALSRACWLNIFDGLSNFDADDNGVDDGYGRLRGVSAGGAYAAENLQVREVGS